MRVRVRVRVRVRDGARKRARAKARHLGGVAVVALEGSVEARAARQALDSDGRHVGARDPAGLDVALLRVRVRVRARLGVRVGR